MEITRNNFPMFSVLQIPQTAGGYLPRITGYPQHPFTPDERTEARTTERSDAGVKEAATGWLSVECYEKIPPRNKSGPRLKGYFLSAGGYAYFLKTSSNITWPTAYSYDVFDSPDLCMTP